MTSAAGSVAAIAAAQLVLLLASLGPATGGACWSNVNSAGRCKEILSQGVSKEECCGGPNLPSTTAYSEEDYDNGALFFWQVLGGGVKCDSCRSSCEGVRCSEGRRCALRRGMPKCVCPPLGAEASCRAWRRAEGPVCGTDGRTYRDACALQRRKCRRPDTAVAYAGQCRSSCAGVRCRHGRSCLLDQNLSAHCVKCQRRCSQQKQQLDQQQQQQQMPKPVCGVDGNTYKSACHLRAAACRAGRAIAVAYKGPCRKYTDCASIQCRPGQLCLTEPHTNRPRCVTCLYRCPRNKELIRERNRHRNRDYQDSRPIALCATNNVTYPSWCHIMKDACLTGLVLETRHAGPCDHHDPAPFYNSSNNSSLIVSGSNSNSGNSSRSGVGVGGGPAKESSLKKDLMKAIGRKDKSKASKEKSAAPSIL